VCPLTAADQFDLTLIANPASPEKLLTAEQDDLRERLAVLDARILAEENGTRSEALRRERELILKREKAVKHSLAQARLSLARIQVRRLRADQSALLANLAALDARISVEEDETLLRELRSARASVVSREAAVRRAIKEAEASLDLQRSTPEVPATIP
jgi:fatty acid/phospholipid biosynthesis enzyme